MADFDIGNSTDINEFDAEDIEKLTFAGIGTGMETFIPFIGLIVILLVLYFVFSIIRSVRRKLKGKR